MQRVRMWAAKRKETRRHSATPAAARAALKLGRKISCMDNTQGWLPVPLTRLAGREHDVLMMQDVAESAPMQAGNMGTVPYVALLFEPLGTGCNR
jgi:hypothetical protein